MDEEKTEIGESEDSSYEEIIIEEVELETAPKVKKKRIPLKYRTKENDIKYRAPLSYRYLRIIAWFFIIVSALPTILIFAYKHIPSLPNSFGNVIEILSFFSNLPLPLFLLANFAFILQRRTDFKRLLTFYGVLAGAMYIAGTLVFIEFGFGLLHAFIPEFDFWSSSLLFGSSLVGSGRSSYVLNIFVDLFLCSLSFCFLFYKPKKYFQGNKIIIFRLFVLLPLLYEFGCLVIKYFVGTSALTIPHFVFFALTGKPPFMFVAFLLIILFLKFHEVRFHKKYPDQATYEEHMNTNAASLKVSIIISIVFLISGLLDIIAAILFAYFYSVRIVTPETDLDALAEQIVSLLQTMGLGMSSTLILAIPFVMLFSFSKTHRDGGKYDKLVPIVGVGLLVFTYFQGFYIVLLNIIPDLVSRFGEAIQKIIEYFVGPLT